MIFLLLQQPWLLLVVGAAAAPVVVVVAGVRIGWGWTGHCRAGSRTREVILGQRGATKEKQSKRRSGWRDVGGYEQAAVGPWVERGMRSVEKRVVNCSFEKKKKLSFVIECM